MMLNSLVVERTGISLPAPLMGAAKAFAERARKPFSKLVQEALREHLERHNALPEQQTEKEAVMRGLEEAFSIEELRSMLERRTREQSTH